MPSQVIPLEGIDKSGFISDVPAVNLPPGAWSDVRNVRFNDGAIRKFLGHSEIFEMLRDLDDDTTAVNFTSIQHVAYWENPNTRYYVVIDRTDAVIDEDGMVTNPAVDTVYTVQLNDDGTSTRIPRGTFEPPTETSSDFWRSTQFNGGFSIVINNGRSTPQHITAMTGVDLPNPDRSNLDNGGLFRDLPGWDSYLDTNGGNALGGNTVTANILIAEGNVLLAGGLVERDDTGVLIRNLNSVVRVSDVAAPGTIPDNWNPFDTTGTADEIIISDTGLITAMRPLRGSVYVYTSDTITQLRITPQGLRASVITKEYGALSQTSVFEFKGQHLIIGSDDIYVFSGNPGDIQSIADGRVRVYFYDNLHANFAEDVQVIRNKAFDELWICYPNLDSADGSYNEALIWNYDDNVWTKRDLPNIENLTIGPIPGGGSTRTVIPIPNGTTSALDAGTQATGTFTINDLPIPTFEGGLQDVQTFVGTATGPVSTIGEISGDSVLLALPNNFQPNEASGAEFSFDPDTNDAQYTNQIENMTITQTNTTGDVSDVTHEIATAIHDMDFGAVGTQTGVTVVDYDDTTRAHITTVADAVPVINIVISAGEGPVGGFNASTFTGGTNEVTTGIDLVNNDGMLWIIPADTGGSGVAMATIFDTFNFEDGVSPNFLQTGTRNIPSGQGIDRFTTTGWEEDDFSGGSLNRTGDLNTQLSFAVTPDLFAMVDYTGGAGPNGDGTVAPHTEAHTLGSVPGAMLIKRTGVAPFGQSDWVFYHKDTFASGDVGFFNLDGRGPSNDNNNPSHFNGTHPTDSVFTIGNSVGSGSGNTNSASSSRYIAYLFASNEINGNSDPNGSIFCGTYDGNGSSSVRTFPLGWRPTRVLIKDVTNDNVVTMAFTNLNANGVELTQYAQVGRSAGQSIYREPTVHPAWEGSFEDTSFRLATNNNLWNRSNTRYVYIAMRESVPAAGLASEFNDEPIFAATGTDGNVITTGVDLRQDGFMFFGGVPTNENPYVPNNFETVFQSGSAAGSGQRARLPRLDNHEVTFGGNGAGDHFITSFQEDGFTLPADVFLNVPGDTWQVFSFADAPGFMSTTEFNSSALARVPDGMGGTMAPRFNIPHTLGQVPRMVLIKRLTRAEAGQNTNSLNPWNVWHQSTGNGLRLSTSFNATTNGISDSGWLQPEGTTHMSTRTTSTEVWTGGNADAYVMYAFGGKDVNGNPAPATPAADDGTLAAGGRLIGGSSFDAFTVDLGWRPGFIMIKATADAAGAQNNWRYWSKEDNFASVRNWNTTDRRNADTTLTVTDTGFSADLQNDSSYIYWCSRDVVPNADGLPEFSLTDFEGNLNSIPNDNLVDFGSATNVTASRDALLAGINATPLPPMNWTATAVGNNQLSLTSDIYGSVGDTGADPHQITTDAVGNRIASVNGETGTQFGDGSAGNSSFEVELGVEDDLDSPAVLETFTVCSGTQGHQGDFLATFVDDDNTIPGNGSRYVLSGVGITSVVEHVTGAGDTINSIVDTLRDNVNVNEEHSYVATTIPDDDMSTTLVLTENNRAVPPVMPWRLVTVHPVDPDGNTGTLVFNGSLDTLGTEGDGAVVGVADSYDPVTVTVTYPTGRDTSDPTDTIFSSTMFAPNASGTAPSTFTILAPDVAVALRGATYTGHTTNGTGNTFMITRTDVGFTDVLYDVTGVGSAETDNTPGSDDDTPATLTITVDREPDLGPIVLNPTVSNSMMVGDSMTALEIRDTIATHLSDFPEFTITTPDAATGIDGLPVLDNEGNIQQYVLVTHNQFGANRQNVDAIYTPTSRTEAVDVTVLTPDPDDDIYSLRLDTSIEDAIQEQVVLADPERPWDAGVLNEARTFVVTGGQDDIFAMDLGGDFDGANIDAFIERRNFQLEPLLDTELLAGFYMHTDSSTPNITVPLTITLQGVDNSTIPVVFPTDPEDIQFYNFNIGGPDGSGNYKVDTRINARMINFRISESGMTGWEIQAMGVAIDKGGTR